MLGLSKQRVDQLVKGKAFPTPEAELASGRIWSREAVEGWARAELRPTDVKGPHTATPHRLASGGWVGYCAACGRVGIGQDLDSETLAVQLVRAHDEIYSKAK
jgi:hypothetical protein